MVFINNVWVSNAFHVPMLFVFHFGYVILGLPCCASLVSVIIPKTKTGHHSVSVYVFSQWTDKVLRAPPDLSTAELVDIPAK